MAGDEDNLSDYERDKIEKQSLVIDIITRECKKDSPWEDVRNIAAALESGRADLGIQNLSGGYTNYTYKVFLTEKGSLNSDNDAPGEPSTALFVKLCFPRAFWNPDPDYRYDVERIANEAEMMRKFAELSPGCVATPYLLLDVGDMKLLATQWAPADEQMANQFIDGVADKRVAKNLAEAIGALHCSDLDKDFNTEARECMIDIFPNMRDKLVAMATSDDADDSSRAGTIARKLGPKLCLEIFAEAENSYRATDVPVHTDLHPFNILVERKPNVLQLETFGEKGSFCICDWEMAMVGPLGLDMGRVFSIPVACIFAHTFSGQSGVTDGLLEFLDVYWDAYSSFMAKNGGKIHDGNNLLDRSYRNAMAWLGWKLFAISVHDWFIPFMPIEKDDIPAFKDSLAYVGIKLMNCGFCGNESNLSVDGLHSLLKQTILEEVSAIKSIKGDGAVRRRRSSVLRASHRRVSNSFQKMGRLSVTKSIIDVAELNLSDTYAIY